MEELLSLDQAKAHARITSTHEDDDLQLKLDVAHAQIADYVKQRLDGDAEWAAEVEAWTDETAPKEAIQAIALQFTALTRARGDDDDVRVSALDENGLAAGVAGLLRRYRDPALA